MSNTIPQLTNDDVRTIRDAAIETGDTVTANRAERALAGDPDAWWLIRASARKLAYIEVA